MYIYEEKKKTQSKNDTVIQRLFSINCTLHTPCPSPQAMAMLSDLHSDLENTYGNFYDVDWIIHIHIDDGTYDTPAYTEFNSPNRINVYIMSWFIENCSYGELLGMVNHELNVHLFADIAQVSADSIDYYSSFHASFSNLTIDGMPRSLVSRALRTITMGTHIGFTPGKLPYNNQTAPGMLTTYESRTQNDDFESTFFPGTSAYFRSPKELHDFGAQLDHSFMGRISLDNNGLPIFSPRAVVYAQMTLKMIDTYICTHGNDQSSQQVITDMLNYYILDLSRTWYESLSNTILHNIYLRTLLFALPPESEIVSYIAQDYVQWLIDDDGNPNPSLGVTVSPDTVAALNTIKLDVLHNASTPGRNIRALLMRAISAILSGWFR